MDRETGGEVENAEGVEEVGLSDKETSGGALFSRSNLTTSPCPF